MAKNVNKVEYNKDILSLLNDLSAINESVILKKEDKKILVQRTNNAKSVAYRLKIDPTAFNFNGDSIAFYKFPEFFQLISCFESPELNQTDDKLVISKDKSKINYLISDSETLMKGPSKINFADPDVSVELKSSDIKELKKMIGLLTTKNAKLSCSKNNVDITLYNSGHDNSFFKSYTASKSATEDIDYSISCDIITLIPDGDYTIEIKKEGIVRFTLNKADISLEIFTAQIDEE